MVEQHNHCANCHLVIDFSDPEGMQKGEHSDRSQCIILSDQIWTKAQAFIDRKNELIKEAAMKQSIIQKKIEEEMLKEEMVKQSGNGE